MQTAKPTSPSMEAIPAWSYHTALSTPLFFDPYGTQNNNENWNTRLAKEKKALLYAEQGITHLTDIVLHNKTLTPPLLSKKYARHMKLPGFAEMVNQLPRPAIKGIEQGTSYEELEWVQLPSKQIARVLQTSGGLATCEPQKIRSKQGLLTPLWVRPVVVQADSLTPRTA